MMSSGYAGTGVDAQHCLLREGGLDSHSHCAFDGLQLHGDFYREPDDVMRGCTLVGAADFLEEVSSGDLSLHSQKGLAHVAGRDWYHGAELFDWVPHSSTVAEMEAARAVSFSDAVQPSELLVSDRTATSIMLEASSAAAVASHIRDFLKRDVTASILKTSPSKFSIKAQVFQDVGGCLANCTLKARLFKPVPSASSCGQNTDGVVLVQLCRRQGDSLAFAVVFGLLAQSLRSVFKLAEEESARHSGAGVRPPHLDLPLPVRAAPASVTFPVPRVPLCADPATACDAFEMGTRCEHLLAPLLDMLCSSAPSAVQAEATAALAATAASSTAGATAVCDALADSPGVLAALVASDRLDVAYPAARLVSTLSKRCGRQLSGAWSIGDLEPEKLNPLVSSELRAALSCGLAASPADSRLLVQAQLAGLPAGWAA